MPLKGAEQFIFSDPSLMKLIYNLVRRRTQTWGTGAAPFPPSCRSRDENLQPKPQPGCLFKAQNPKGTLNKQSSSHILPTERDPSCCRLQKGFQRPGAAGAPCGHWDPARMGARMTLWDPG